VPTTSSPRDITFHDHDSWPPHFLIEEMRQRLHRSPASRRLVRTSAGLAFAGFFYDLVLALGAHVAEGEAARGAIALFTMVITVLAWRTWRQRSREIP
jgi:hypothetical protein